MDPSWGNSGNRRLTPQAQPVGILKIIGELGAGDHLHPETDS